MNELFGLQNNSLNAFTEIWKSIPQNSQDAVQSFPEFLISDPLNSTHLNPEENPNFLIPQQLASPINFDIQNLSQTHQSTPIAGKLNQNNTVTDVLTGDNLQEHSRVRRSAEYNSEIYEPVKETGINEIDALTGYSKWNLDNLNHQITYSFLKAGDSYYNNQPGLAELKDTTKNLVRQVITDLEGIIPIDFVEVPYSYNNPGLITLMGVDTSWGGYAYSPGGDLVAGDVYLSNNCDFDGQWGYKIVSHEIGHALGLKHPGDYSEMGGGAEAPFLPVSEDNTDWTVMSYNYADAAPTDYQSLDIQALKSLYPEQNSLPAITINNTNFTEGNRLKFTTFKVSLDEPSEEMVSVDFKTVNRSAKAGYDYRYKSGTLTFLPGETTKTIRIAVRDDHLDETKEVFGVSLSHPKNAEITDNWGRAIIKDND